jgi:predicted component of viral defense system (DUF524 family)
MRELVVITWHGGGWLADVFDKVELRDYDVIGFNKDSEQRLSLNPLSQFKSAKKWTVPDDFDLSWYVWENFRFIDNDTKDSPRYDEIINQMNKEAAEKEAEEKARQEKLYDMHMKTDWDCPAPEIRRML